MKFSCSTRDCFIAQRASKIDWFSACNSARLILLALNLIFSSAFSWECFPISVLYLSSHVCLSLAILPLSSLAYSFQYFVNLRCSSACFRASSRSLWMFSVSLTLLSGFPFLPFRSSSNLLFLRPKLLKSSSNNSRSFLSSFTLFCSIFKKYRHCPNSAW